VQQSSFDSDGSNTEGRLDGYCRIAGIYRHTATYWMTQIKKLHTVLLDKILLARLSFHLVVRTAIIKACDNTVMTTSEDILGRLWQSLHEATTQGDRKSTRLNSSHVSISYAVFCLKKKQNSVLK